MMSEFDYNCLIFRFSPFHVNSNLWYTKKQTHRYGNSDLASSPMLDHIPMLSPYQHDLVLCSFKTLITFLTLTLLKRCL